MGISTLLAGVYLLRADLFRCKMTFCLSWYKPRVRGWLPHPNCKQLSFTWNTSGGHLRYSDGHICGLQTKLDGGWSTSRSAQFALHSGSEKVLQGIQSCRSSACRSVTPLLWIEQHVMEEHKPKNAITFHFLCLVIRYCTSWKIFMHQFICFRTYQTLSGEQSIPYASLFLVLQLSLPFLGSW